MPHTVEDINTYLFPDMPCIHTDVGVVFGAKSMSGEVARTAALLKHQNRFDKIIVTGGNQMVQPSALFAFASAGYWNKMRPHLRDEFLSTRIEADYMRDVLMQMGVADQSILEPDRDSKNTGQNVANIASCLQDFNSATLIGLAPATRRIMGTVRKHFSMKALKLTTANVYPFGMHWSNWDQSMAGRYYVGREMRKVDSTDPNNYFKAGYCVPVDIERECQSLEYASYQ